MLSAEIIAQSFMKQFITAFNASDTESWLQTLKFPHVRITPTGRIFVEDESASRRGFNLGIQFRSKQAWDHSVVDEIEVVQHSSEKIHLTNRFTRYKADGTKYLTGHALWILTKVDGQWRRLCVSNIDIQRFDMSAEEFRQALMKRDLLLQGEK
jgi:hypothetical protein